MPKPRSLARLRKLAVWPQLRHVIGGAQSLAAQFAACHADGSSSAKVYAIYAIRDPRFVDPFGHPFGPAFYVGMTYRLRTRVLGHLRRAVDKKRPNLAKDQKIMAILKAGEVPQFELLSCVLGLSPALRAEQLWTRYFAAMGYPLTYGISSAAYSAPEYAHVFEPDYATEALTIGEAFEAGLSIHLQCLRCGHIRNKVAVANPSNRTLGKKRLGSFRAEQRHCFQCLGQAFCAGAT
ncbi:MAG: hypothetical protein ACRCY3_14215 [Sphingorhabdus sp.]